ncbi:Monopolin complex subunit CSM1 [Nakaseomyces bracarensis]|uniref:Monopolin complex subunit CSM1 n=1 Tax=Nakaseomyces bracarensis TaxID=273131 RepID=A0ABR4NT02_9SACH
MDPLTQYKQSVQRRLDSADLVVERVVAENTLLKQKLESREVELDDMRRQLEAAKKQLGEAQEQTHRDMETIEVIKDLFEHLCGVRVHRTYEDDTGLWFDSSQGSKNGIMDYKLGFVKSTKLEDNANANEKESGHVETEVIYVPLLKQRTAEELQELQKKLPDYLFETLSFPLRSLNQFYVKMSKSLNKRI